MGNEALYNSNVSVTDEQTLVSSVVCAASGAYTRSGIIKCESASSIVLFVKYDPAAASGNFSIIPLVSNNATALAADDSWFAIAQVASPIIAPAALAGALATGSDFGATPNPFPVVLGTTNLTATAATSAASDSRLAIRLDIRPFKRFHVQYAENGATGTPGTIAITYSLLT